MKWRRARFAVLLFPLTILIIGTGACEELVENTDEITVNVPIEKRYFKVDSALLSVKKGQTLLHKGYIDVNPDSVLEAQRVDYVTSAKVTEMILGVKDPRCSELFFLNEASVVVSATADFRNSFQVAHINNINAESNAVELNLMNQELVEEIVAGGFYFKLYGKPSNMPFYKSGGIRMFIEGEVSLNMNKN